MNCTAALFDFIPFKMFQEFPTLSFPKLHHFHLVTDLASIQVDQRRSGFGRSRGSPGSSIKVADDHAIVLLMSVIQLFSFYSEDDHAGLSQLDGYGRRF